MSARTTRTDRVATIARGAPLGAFHRVWAIAKLSVDAAFRSRLFVTLLLSLLLAVIGLPMAIKGDGTLPGQIKVTLTYSLGLVAFILGAATLWSACGAVSQEIQEKQIQMLTSKPVHRVEIWIGKWLGLLAVNALLLILAGTLLYAVIQWRTRESVTTAEQRRALGAEVLLARRLVNPQAAPVEEEAHAILENLRQTNKIAAGVDEAELLESIRRQLRQRSLSVAPGQSRQWNFTLPAALAERAEISLRYRFSGSSRYRTPASGVWQIADDTGGTSYTRVIQNQQGGPYTVAIPRGSVRPGQELQIRFLAAPRGETAGIVFDREQGLELLIRESSFGANYARTLAIILCHLALLAALGLSVGTFFSFPVATFVATCLIVIAGLTHSYSDTATQATCGHAHHHAAGHATEPGASLLEQTGKLLIRHIKVVVAPAMQLDPLTRVADGILVNWGMLAQAVGLLLLLYPGVLGCIGGIVLARRELALPDTTGM